MNNYCEWCRGQYPEEGCCLGTGSKCAWEEAQDEGGSEDGIRR